MAAIGWTIGEEAREELKQVGVTEIYGTLFYTVICQKWVEMDSWRGFPEDSGYSLHLTKADRGEFVAEYWSCMSDGTAPESYDCPDPNSKSFECKIDKDVYDLLNESANGISAHGTFFPDTGVFMAHEHSIVYGGGSAKEIANYEEYYKRKGQYEEWEGMLFKIGDLVKIKDRSSDVRGTIAEFLDNGRAVVYIGLSPGKRDEVFSLDNLTSSDAEKRRERADRREELLKKMNREKTRAEVERVLSKGVASEALSEEEKEDMLRAI